MYPFEDLFSMCIYLYTVCRYIFNSARMSRIDEATSHNFSKKLAESILFESYKESCVKA